VTNKPDAFVFDLGNVLVTFDFSRFYSRLRAAGARSDALSEKSHQPLRDAYEAGSIDDGTFVDESMRLLRFSGDPAFFRSAWREIFELNAPMEAALQRLHQQGFPLFVLSNTNNLHLTYLRDRFPFFQLFTGGAYSHLARSMKPGEAIFRKLIAECRLDPGQALYIDDRPENIATGQKLGFQTHCYDRCRHGDFDELLSQAGIHE
jgi:putative hydrolase of the HAD superfamily